MAPTIVVLVAVSLLMVVAMVRFSRTVITGRGPRARWGAVYLLLWAGIIALFLRLMALTGKEIAGKNLALLALVAGSWFVVNAASIAMARAIDRANARSPARAAASRRRTAAPAVWSTPAEEPRGSWLRENLALARNVALVLVVIAVGELIPPLRALESYFAAHRPAWVAAAVVAAVVGILLLAGGGAHMALAAPSPDGGRASFAEVKAAWRSGVWRRRTRWRRLFVMAAGAALILFGTFGLLFVVGPPGIKLLAALVVAYVVTRTVHGWMRAG